MSSNLVSDITPNQLSIETCEEALNELSTLQDMLRWSISRMNEAGLYFGHGTDNARDDAVMLITHALHLPWNIEQDWQNAKLTRSEREHVIHLLSRRINERMPTPYLTGEAWFYGLPFSVDERVLIPRSPIAEIIALRFNLGSVIKPFIALWIFVPEVAVLVLRVRRSFLRHMLNCWIFPLMLWHWRKKI